MKKLVLILLLVSSSSAFASYPYSTPLLAKCSGKIGNSTYNFLVFPNGIVAKQAGLGASEVLYGDAKMEMTLESVVSVSHSELTISFDLRSLEQIPGSKNYEVSGKLGDGTPLKCIPRIK